MVTEAPELPSSLMAARGGLLPFDCLALHPPQPSEPNSSPLKPDPKIPGKLGSQGEEAATTCYAVGTSTGTPSCRRKWGAEQKWGRWLQGLPFTELACVSGLRGPGLQDSEETQQ